MGHISKLRLGTLILVLLAAAYSGCSFIGEGIGIQFDNRTDQALEVILDYGGGPVVIPPQSKKEFGFTNPPEDEFLVIIRIASGPVIFCHSLTEKEATSEAIIIDDLEPLTPLPPECASPR